MRVAHLTTVDLSLRYLVLPQLTKVNDLGGEAVGISANGPYVAELEELGVRHITLPGATRSVDPVADLKAMVSLWRILREERPDVIHTHTPKPGLYGRVIGRIAGVPVVLNTIHGLYATPDDSVVKRSIVYALEAFASRVSDVELVQSAEDFRLVT
ncbi:MAG: glycosyltransferase, partial [Actinobacteria bacterium]|nr:glycosyltransferase [Actinomycetota bacterium]